MQLLLYKLRHSRKSTLSLDEYRCKENNNKERIYSLVRRNFQTSRTKVAYSRLFFIPLSQRANQTHAHSKFTNYNCFVVNCCFNFF